MRTICKEIIEKFKSYLINEEKSKLTIDKYIRDITKFGAWIGDKELQKEVVIEYKRYLGDRYAPASVNSILSSLNSFFDFNEWIDCKVKIMKIQKQLFVSEDKTLSKRDYIKLLEVAEKKKNKRLYCLLQTICSTGIRVSELRFITVDAVNQRRASIQCKSKIRTVILPKELCKMLKNYIKKNKIKSGSVFVTKTGKPLDRSNIWRAMKSLCKLAGVNPSKVFPHNLRKLFAVTYYSMQKDVVRLADILGHSSVNTTRIYTIETGNIHRKQIQNLGLVIPSTT